jgi:hypothetical protein
MVFADRNFNGRFESEDSLLRLEQGTAGSSTSINATASRISIQPLGIIEYPHAGSSFEVFPTSSSASHVSEPSALSRHICLSKPGRIRLTEFGQGC